MAKKNQELDIEGNGVKTFKDRVFNFKWFYDEAEKIIKIAPSFKDFLTGKNIEGFLVKDFYIDDNESPTFKIVDTERNGLIVIKSSNELK
jgi:hypothetical protein